MNIRRDLIREFEQRCSVLTPSFCRHSESVRAEDEYCFMAQGAEHIFWFILLQLRNRQGIQFTVELGYSSDQSYPLQVLPDLPIDKPLKGHKRGVARNGCFRFRLGFLTDKEEDCWWNIPSAPGMTPVLNSIFSTIELNGLPFLHADSIGTRNNDRDKASGNGRS